MRSKPMELSRTVKRSASVRAGGVLILLLFCVPFTSTWPLAKAQDPRAVASRYIPQGSIIEQALRGNFGPCRDGIVAVYRMNENAGPRYAGLALIPAAGGGYREATLADIHQFDNLTVENSGISTVLFADLDGDRENEVLILIKGLRRVPESGSFLVVSVQDWHEGAFRILHDHERYFGDRCESALCVKSKIAALIQYRGSYVSHTAGISADLAIALDESGVLTGTWHAVYGRAHFCDRLTFRVEPAGSSANLVRWSDAAERYEVIGHLAASRFGATIRFVKDLGAFDCGAGHPLEIRLKRR